MQSQKRNGTSMSQGASKDNGSGWRLKTCHWRQNPHKQEKNSFRTWPLKTFEGPSACIQNWKLLGTFSTTTDRKMYYGNKRPSFFKREYIPDNESIEVSMDLGASPKNIVPYDTDRRKTLRMLLHWILDNKHIIVEPENPLRIRANVVCGQHILTILAMTPYMRKCPWTIWATKFHGTVYLSEYKPEESTGYTANINICGNRFHHYLTGGNADEECDPNKEFRTLITSNLGKHSLLYSAQVVGADPDLFEDNFSNLESFLGAKTCSTVNSQSSKAYFMREKLLGIWAGNTFSQIPRALIGFRKRNLVNSIKKYDIEEIPLLVENSWSPNVVFNFVEKFLDLVQTTVEDNPDVVCVFKRQEHGPITWEVLPKTDNLTVLEDWFITGMKTANGLQAVPRT